MIGTSRSTPKRKTRRYQFTLRTLLVVVVLLSGLFSWLGLKIRQGIEQRKAAAALSRLGVEDLNKMLPNCEVW